MKSIGEKSLVNEMWISHLVITESVIFFFFLCSGHPCLLIGVDQVRFLPSYRDWEIGHYCFHCIHFKEIVPK